MFYNELERKPENQQTFQGKILQPAKGLGENSSKSFAIRYTHGLSKEKYWWYVQIYIQSNANEDTIASKVYLVNLLARSLLVQENDEEKKVPLLIFVENSPYSFILIRAMFAAFFLFQTSHKLDFLLIIVRSIARKLEKP